MNGPRVTVALTGMDDRLKPAEGSCAYIHDMERDAEGVWQPVAGTLDITTFGPGTEGVTALHWFNPRGGQRWLLAERRFDAESSRIVYADWWAGGATVIAERRRLDSVQLGTQFIDFGRWCYILSPVDGLIRWNGFETWPAGFTTPPAPPLVAGPGQGFTEVDRAAKDYNTVGGITAELRRGVGPFASSSAADESWLYGYAVTLVNDLGQESPPSAIVWAVGANVDPDGRYLVRLSLARPPANARGVRWWRTTNLAGITTPAGGADLYLLHESPACGPVDLIDHKSDGELGPLLDRDQLGPTPVGARALVFWNSTAWAGGMPDNPTRMQYSSPLYVEQWPTENYLEIGSAQTGGIVAGAETGRGLVVFKEGGVYIIRGNPAAGFHVEAVDESVGTESPLAVVNVPSVGLLFLARSGPHAVVSSGNLDVPLRVVPLGGPIARWWRRKVGSNLRGARAVYDPVRGEVWFAVPEGGDPDPRVGIVLHVATGAWSVREDWPIGAMTHYRGRTFVSSWGNPGIHVLTRASRTKFDEAIAPQLHFAARFDVERHVHRVEVELVPWGEVSTVAVETRGDSASWTEQVAARPLVHPKHDRPAWGTALWDAAATWSDFELSHVAVSVREHFARLFETRLLLGRSRVVSAALVVGDTTGPSVRERR